MGCLVPEFRSEKRRGRGTQLFEKTQCFYVTFSFSVCHTGELFLTSYLYFLIVLLPFKTLKFTFIAKKKKKNLYVVY